MGSGPDLGPGPDPGEAFGVWAETAPPCPTLPEFSGDQHSDIAIIGAGYTGLSAGIHLARAGADCAVLEAREPGWGESGRNTGWLEPNWWMKDPQTIRARFGVEAGDALSRWVVTGPQLLAQWTQDYGLEFEWDAGGLVMGTADPKRAGRLLQESRDWQVLGIDHPYLDARAMADHVPGAYFQGGLLLPGGGTLNPLALSRELCRALSALGVPVFLRSPVKTIEHNDGLWRLSTPRGTLTCRSLVLATGASTGALCPEVASAQALWRAGVIASEPYAALDDLLPAGSAVADLDLANVFTLRRAAENRLVTSVLAPAGQSREAEFVAGPFMRKFRRLFPDFPEPVWRHVHYGEIGLSRDMLPRLCAIGPNAWSAFGYSGTGINYGLLFGGLLSGLVLSEGRAKTIYPVEPPAAYPLRKTIAAALRYVHAPISRNIVSRLGPRPAKAD